MATVTTTSETDPLAPASLPPISRDMITGYLYTIVRTATSTLTLYRSTDSGGSWGSYAAFTHTGIQEWSSLVVDRNGWAHLAYRLGVSNNDSLHYRRCNLSTAAWGSALQYTSNYPNGGVNGAVFTGIDLAVVRKTDGSYVMVVASCYKEGTSQYGLLLHGNTISTGGTLASNDTILSGSHSWYSSGTSPGRFGASCEVEHTGDGFQSSTPHVWIAWGRQDLRMVKLSWTGSGWSGPGSSVPIRSGIPAQDYCNGRFDGTQWLMPVISPDDATMVRVYQRNKANTLTTVFDTPTHTTGNIRQLSISYDNITKNIRVYAVGTSTAVLYYIDYDRAGAVWGSWTIAVATAVLTSGAEWGVRRGGTSGNAKFDVVTAHSGAPNTIVHTAQAIVSTPSIAVWDTSAQPYYNGGAADVAAALTLDWIFSDPDPGQTQGSYALSRQIGAGALNYWRASDSTWQVAEVQNSSGTTALTLAGGWAAASDANYTFKVKVWDNVGTVADGYSAAMIIVPSALVNPTITAPVAAAVLGTDQVTMTWTVAEQTAYRVRLSTNPGGVVNYDSGFVASTDLIFTVPNRLANGTGWTIELTTRNNEGLSSTPQTKNFTVVYSAPPAVISTFTPQASLGYITVTPSALSPVGAQPAIVDASLYRRVVVGAVLNANPTFAGNVTGWAIGGGGTPGTLSYSTAQFHEGPGAARYVPNAAGAAIPTVESSVQTSITAGSLYVGSAWMRPDTSTKPLTIQLNWYTSGGSFISSVSTTAAAIATAWQYLEVIGDPSLVPTAAKVTVSVGETSTPVAVDAFYADEVKLSVYNSDAGTRVAAHASVTAAVNDWQAVSSPIVYEYRWIATGANGTTINGPWTQ